MRKSSTSARMSGPQLRPPQPGPTYAEMAGDMDESQPAFEKLLKLQKEVQSNPKYPSFREKFKEIWAQHELEGLKLHHQSGLLILEMKKEMANDPDRGRALLTVIAEDLGRSLSDGSREVAFATRWPTFEDFKKAEPDITTWSQLKEKLAELSRAEKKENNGTAKPKKSSERHRDVLVERFQKFREEISKVKDDFSVKQLAAVEGTTEAILDDLEELALPLKRLAKNEKAS